MIRDLQELLRLVKAHRAGGPPPERIIQIGGSAPRFVAGWWGKITEFTASTVLGKAIRVTGTYPNFDEPEEGEEEVDVIIGVEAMHYCPETEDRHGLFIASGAGVAPDWTLVQHVRIPYTEPDAEDLHEDQDDGGGIETCECEGA